MDKGKTSVVVTGQKDSSGQTDSLGTTSVVVTGQKDNSSVPSIVTVSGWALGPK